MSKKLLLLLSRTIQGIPLLGELLGGDGVDLVGGDGVDLIGGDG